jgi:hypothetical protein
LILTKFDIDKAIDFSTIKRCTCGNKKEDIPFHHFRGGKENKLLHIHICKKCHRTYWK